jgi:hypothetical protein
MSALREHSVRIGWGILLVGVRWKEWSVMSRWWTVMGMLMFVHGVWLVFLICLARYEVWPVCHMGRYSPEAACRWVSYHWKVTMPSLFVDRALQRPNGHGLASGMMNKSPSLHQLPIWKGRWSSQGGARGWYGVAPWLVGGDLVSLDVGDGVGTSVVFDGVAWCELAFGDVCDWVWSGPSGFPLGGCLSGLWWFVVGGW